MTTTVYNICYKKEEHLIFMDWDGYSTSEQFREGSELMLQLLAANGTTKILADVKDMVLISTEDQQWVINDFFPRLIEAGGKTIALVNPHHYFNKVAIETLSFKANEKSLVCRIFHNLKEATEWLKSI